MARRTDVERVEEYIQHQRQALEACTGDSGEDRSRPWLKNTLATFYGETNHFQEPHRLLQVTMMIQKRQRLAPQTILTYLACLKKFVDYLVIRDNIDAARIQAAMNEVKSIYTTSAACDSRRKADERFKLVPSHSIVVARHEQVMKLLQENFVEELAAALNPAFQEEEVDALSSMPEEQLMNQQPVFCELMSAPVLSDADTDSLESAVPEEVMSVPQEMSVQRFMEMPAVFTHNVNDEQPGTSDVPQNAPVDAAVATEKRAKYSQENECIICHVSVVRIDRHLKHVHGDLLIETEQTLIKDYYRFRNSKTVVRFCSTCMRRVASVPTHKSRCPGHLEKLPEFRSVK